MKVPSREELNDYVHAISIGAAKGAAVGLGVSMAGLTYVKKYHLARYQARGGFARTFLLMAPVLACGVTSMEFASRDFERMKYLPTVLEEERKKREALSKLPTGQRIQHYCIENKYKIILTGWAASLGGSFWYINRDKYMTKAQKVVQARMYAQGLTVALLLASMALTTVSTGEERRREIEQQQEEGWRKIVAQEERRLESEHKSKYTTPHHESASAQTNSS